MLKIILKIFAAIVYFTLAEGQCGKLNATLLGNFKKTTELNEFPWIGGIAFRTNFSRTDKYRCVAVLISKRYLLTVAHCFRSHEFTDPYAVVLGNWNFLGSTNAKEYEIEEFGTHPNFTEDPLQNDIATIRLAKNVDFSEDVEPICLLPCTNINHVGQFLPFAGFQNDNTSQPLQLKSLGHVISSKQCNFLYEGGFANIDNFICTTCDERDYIGLLGGSPLMGVTIKNSEPHKIYLIGLQSIGSDRLCNNERPEVFTRVSIYQDWINLILEDNASK